MGTVKMGLILENGKFYRDGVEVAPVIWDTEQIALLRAEERRLEQVEKDALLGPLDVDVSVGNIEFELNGEFTCICGAHVSFSEDHYTDDPDDIEMESFDDYFVTKDKRESPRLQSWDESASMFFLILDISDYGISRNASDRLAEIRPRPQCG